MSNYQTYDFYLTSYLRAIGHEMDQARREGARFAFVFPDSTELRDDIKAFFDNSGDVPPQNIVGSIKELKALIHNN